MLSTISAVTRTGDFLPGITAAVMTTSLSGDHVTQQLALPAVETFRPAPARSRARPAASLASMGSSTKRPPRLWTCSLAAGRRS